MNTAIRYLYAQEVATGEAQCYLCGTSCKPLHSVARGIADTFNSHYLVMCPSSLWLCDACQWYFNDKSHPEFRKMSLIVQSGAWRNWERPTMKQGIQQWLEVGLPDDSYLAVSLSKKKHILLQAPFNAKGSKTLAIQLEEQVAHVKLTDWQQVGRMFTNLLQLGHNKGEILSGNLYGSTLRKHGKIAEALMYSQSLECWRNSPIIELYSYVTIIEKEESKDGTGEPSELPVRTRDQADSGNVATCRVERDRQRVPEQVSHGDMANVRGESGSSVEDHKQLSLFSEQD